MGKRKRFAKVFTLGKCSGSKPDFMNFIIDTNGQVIFAWEYSSEQIRDQKYNELKRKRDTEGDDEFDIFRGKTLPDGTVELLE